jgi:CheY-like chemotaxis protein
LVIDDHALNLKLLERVLQLDGHEVKAVESLGAAQEAIAKQPFELVIVDFQLPDGDGLDLARRIKSDPRTSSWPVVACTASAMAQDRDSAFAAGCDAYVSKPIDTRSFGALVASLIGGEST